MGWFGDLADEWKKASTGEKIMIGGGVIGVIAIALYIRNQSQQAQPNTAATGADMTGGGGGGGIQTVPGPNGSQLPILPGGLCQQFDQQGNLTGYIPCNTPPPPSPTPYPPPEPVPGPGPIKCPRGTTLCNGKCQPMGLLCRNEINPHHAHNRNPGQRPEKGTHHASSARVVPDRIHRRTPPVVRHAPNRQHTTVAHTASQRNTARAKFPVGGNVQYQNTPYGSGYGTVNGIPLNPPGVY